jgi:MFS family permease
MEQLTPATRLDDAASPPRLDASAGPERLRDLSPQQWKSGAAAWLGWLFDGLDMHLYVLVATPFVAELLQVANPKDEQVGYCSSWIQAAFLIGWALGGSFFGIVGDRVGRSRTLMLTILTYALFTGLAFFAQTWWHLLIFRFLAALGIGGEWAVGSSLLSETWPRHWRPWLAAVLQTAVNIGVMLAALASFLLAEFPVRTVFLVGVLPAFLVLWIRRAVPETEEWHTARSQIGKDQPGFLGPVRRITILTLLVCALSLTAHWAFLFWFPQHLRNLPELVGLEDGEKSRIVAKAMWLITAVSIVGNFLAAALARWLGYRRAIALLCLGYFLSLAATYGAARGQAALEFGYVGMGLCQGIFALFTMYLPPLFPTLLRTSGAGFCYNIGRIAAGFGTVIFGESHHG